ncbi:hypothetical protein Ciccas_011615 [Cichlidogyrus casuarinus]|uniref:SWI/SNF complex subunit SMARCC2 n=1 Tax=Cichlidogyrus casuarinus TaxID=1844966 RepID=A0ABD2PQR0_9PLAT
MVLVKPKDGSPSLKFFENPEVIANFDPIRTWLTRNHKKYIQSETPTNKNLATTCLQLIQFQETQFGPKKAPKLPHKLFLDFRSGGSLSHILLTCFKFRHDQNWRKIDFTSSSRLDKHLEMIACIKKDLESAGLWSPPKIYLDNLDKTMQAKLDTAAKNLKAVVTENKEEATHILCSPPANWSEESNVSRVRVVFAMERALLLHWAYAPGSHLTWYTGLTSDWTTSVDPHPKCDGPWEVDARWLLYSEEFGEWMNEEDFVKDEAQLKNASRPTYTPDDLLTKIADASAKKKRKRSPSPETGDKKKRNRPTGTKTPGKKVKKDDDFGDDENTRESDITRDFDDPEGTKATPVTGVQPLKGRQSVLFDLDDEMQEFRPEAGDEENQNDLGVVEQAHCVIIPSYSAWFDYDAIHGIERRALPEFFNQKNKSKTPETYMAYRNFMIDTYRLNPQEYLSFTACRRNLSGDVCCVLRVHAFLEQWGLINYQAYGGASGLAGAISGSNASEAARLAVAASLGPPSTAHFHILTDSASGLQPIGPQSSDHRETKKEREEMEKTPMETADEKPKTLDPELKQDQYATAEAQGDFEKNQTLVKGASKDGWTDQETLLLLEALEMFKDDWNSVAEHVGNRTQEECILHFLRLPIEDAYLEGTDPALKNSSITEALADSANPVPPFSKSGNPILSTVAFLAATVDSRVAASACQAALMEYSKLKDQLPAGMLREHKARVEAAVKAGHKIEPEKFGLETIGGAKAPEDEDAQKKTQEPMETDEKDKEEAGKEKEKTSSVPANPDSLGTAACVALSAAATKARQLALVEEKRIKGLVAQLVETQLKKLDIKLKQFQELESILEREHELLEQQRLQLLQDRQAFHMEVIKTMENRARALVAQQHQAMMSGHHPGPIPMQQRQLQSMLMSGAGGPVPTSAIPQPPMNVSQEPLPPASTSNASSPSTASSASATTLQQHSKSDVEAPVVPMEPKGDFVPEKTSSSMKIENLINKE